MRLGIYIGSFNPPHLGHKKVIDFLLEENYVDKMNQLVKNIGFSFRIII